MLRNNTYKKNLEKQRVNGEYSDEILDLANQVEYLISIHRFAKFNDLDLTKRIIETYKVTKDSAKDCSLSDKDIHSWIIESAVDEDKLNNNHTSVRGIVKLILYSNNLLPIPSYSIISHFIHEDCYEELVEILGQKSE